jgi:RNA polymerase sigma-70 factor (ECF subfamily)
LSEEYLAAMSPQDTDALLQGVSQGDRAAQERLWKQHRDRLRRMVRARIDPFLAACVDPSDVVQDALLDAAHKFPAYLQARPLPFYPWLRCLTLERMVRLRRHHQAHKRNPGGERGMSPLRDGSTIRLADVLAAKTTTIGGSLMRAELRRKLENALEGMSDRYREVLTMHDLEEFSFREIGEATGVAEGTIKVRHFRALQQITKHLENDPGLAQW